MPSQKLREAIRSGEIQCDCWNRGIRPGFHVVGGELRLTNEPQAHFGTCLWAAAVAKVYSEERRLDHHR